MGARAEQVWSVPVDDRTYSPPPPIPTGLRGRCPRCGEGHLFKGFLSLRPSCEACGLDYTHFDSADGPAFFVMSIVGLVVVGLALWLEITFEPPIWVHALVALTLSVGLSLILVRPLKGLLIALQFRNRAEEGRFES
ncbi:DUF983 domain-containing protein [Methylobacterium sp. NMS14P]|uniref:DUF983 domain-containing protein n=1 Tax=Methylobacterium sp. NMS14P TaxID=2894310 RepID=UPI00235A0E81|nr:DUF983 domain-containing protein [Methylobacterium sp. NMS14P]WCS25289.1 DUF983 domain-containing protein [Methylobacterium sp. NMS14P]